ncbi:MAG: hypothetical protein J6X55_17500 [Victivallales bacterium]|nr:hypothetical protein [Victivallales bacterium]
MDDDCWLLGIKRNVPQLTLNAALTVSNGDGEPLRNGYDRPYNGQDNAWLCANGDSVSYDFGAPTPLSRIRLVFDSDFSRCPLNMVSNYYKQQAVFEPPATLVKAYHIEADGKEVFRDDDNHQRLVFIPLDITAKSVKLVIDAVRTPDAPTKIFAFDVQ